MKLILKCSVFAIFFMLIAGCGPVYKREYSFVPPKSSVGKMCTAQCVTSKNSCQQMCNLSTENCRLRARQDAIYQFEQYKRDRRHDGKDIDKNLSDFDHGAAACSSSCNCEPAYRECFSACGGEVLQRDVCVAFCDKQ